MDVNNPSIPAIYVRINYGVAPACIANWAPRPMIDADIAIMIRQYDIYSPATYTIVGNHDKYPWHELYLNEYSVFGMPFDVCVWETDLSDLIDNGNNKYQLLYGGEHFLVP